MKGKSVSYIAKRGGKMRSFYTLFLLLIGLSSAVHAQDAPDPGSDEDWDWVDEADAAARSLSIEKVISRIEGERSEFFVVEVTLSGTFDTDQCVYGNAYGDTGIVDLELPFVQPPTEKRQLPSGAGYATVLMKARPAGGTVLEWNFLGDRRVSAVEVSLEGNVITMTNARDPRVYRGSTPKQAKVCGTDPAPDLGEPKLSYDIYEIRSVRVQGREIRIETSRDSLVEYHDVYYPDLDITKAEGQIVFRHRNVGEQIVYREGLTGWQDLPVEKLVDADRSQSKNAKTLTVVMMRG
ncbi:hypothetical protein KKG31_08955, partial [Patescibacteria group bacterium]|nr:hypothetical protein [Patescibacteria group bacterium]